MNAGRVVAVIDVGSNSVRLLVTRQLTASAFEVVDEESFDARLGEGHQGGLLSAEGMERGVAAMRLVSQVAAAYQPSAIVVAGTEALRRASNAPRFLETVRRETGLGIHVLSGDEEAFASFLGVVNSTSLRDGCIIDIGGGSLEVIEVEGREFRRSRSAPLGAIYATETYFRADPPAPRDVRALRKAARQQLAGVAPNETLFGVGGAVRNLARIIRLRRRYPLRRLHGLILKRPEVRRLAQELATMDREARRRIPGVSGARIDTLPAAAVVIDEAMEVLGAATLSVSGQGLREGLTWQEMLGPDAVLPDVRAASIAGLARANGVDVSAAEPVVVAANGLFEATQPLHHLNGPARDLLLAAARLAGIGMHIDYYNRDRHAGYLVHSGDLHGFSHREIVLLGELVRCADSGTPDFTAFKSIVEVDDARMAGMLVPLLGAARAIRRRSPSPVRETRLALKGASLTVVLRAAAPVDAEIIALERQQRRFESALKAKLVVSARA